MFQVYTKYEGEASSHLSPLGTSAGRACCDLCLFSYLVLMFLFFLLLFFCFED